MEKKRQKPFARALFLLGILIGIAIGVMVSKRLFEPVKESTESEFVEMEDVRQLKSSKKKHKRKTSSSDFDEELAKLQASIDSLAMDSMWNSDAYEDSLYNSDAIWSWEDTIQIDTGPLSYDSAVDVSSTGDIEMARDVLIAVKQIIPSGDKSNFSCDSGDELDSLLVDYTDGVDKYELRVEFWKSPLNYKGYILTRNKLVLYGIYQFNEVKLEYLSDGRLKMYYLDDMFVIRCSDNYVPFR